MAAARFLVDGKLHGAAPAPYRALDLVAAARTATRDEAFAAEDDALADLMLSDELRAGLYAFDLVQKRARRPAGAPDKSLARPVTKVGVVGAGLMAAQIALLFVRRLQVPVVMTDLDQARVDSGVGYVHAEIDKQLSRGRLSADAASRQKALITGSVSKDGFADADFVIEAVFEELAVKQQVFAEVEAVVSAGLRAGDQHLLAVGHRDGVRAGAPGAGGRLPLLQPGRGAAARRGGPRRGDRRRRGGDRARRRPRAQEELRDRRRPARVRGEPAAHPVPRRDHPARSTRAPRSRSPSTPPTLSACR